jgi:hypothetical protein
MNIATDTRRSTDSVSEFDTALAEWCAARAEIAQLDASRHSTDEENSAAGDRIRAAIWAVIRAPARTECSRRDRAMFTQTLFNDAANDGRPTDNHHMAALSIMVAEIVGPAGTIG